MAGTNVVRRARKAVAEGMDHCANRITTSKRKMIRLRIHQTSPTTRPVTEAETEEDRSGSTRGSRKVGNGSSYRSRRPRGRRRNNEDKVKSPGTRIHRRTGNATQRNVASAIAPSSSRGRTAGSAVRSIATSAAGNGQVAHARQDLYLFPIVLDHHDKSIFKKAKSRRVAEP